MLINQVTNRQISGNTLLYFIAGLVVLIIAFLVVDNYILIDEPEVIAENELQSTVETTDTTNETVADEAKAVLHNSVAVLPFENLSSNPDDAYFAVGIHEEILDNLAKIQDLSAISRLSVLRYEGADKSIPEIASELNVETVMKGSVGYADNRINIDVQLFDASGNDQLWSSVYERELSDIFVIRAEIVKHIVMALGAEVTTTEWARIESVPTHSLEAYKLYLKTKAIPSIIGENKPDVYYQILDQAIALDPGFALAHAFKARGYALAKRTIRPIGGLTLEEMERAILEHAEMALTLDPNMGLAHMALAEIHYSHLRNTEAKQAYDRALQLNPNEMHILNAYARFLAVIKEYGEAIRLGQRVLELAPYVGTNHYLQGWTFMDADNPAAAAEQFRLAIALDPDFTRQINLGLAEILLGNKTEALEALRIAEQMIDETITTRGIARLAYAYSRLGFQEDAKRLFDLIQTRIANGRFINDTYLALAYLSIGEVEKARTLLNHDPYDAFNTLNYIKPGIVKGVVD